MMPQPGSVALRALAEQQRLFLVRHRLARIRIHLLRQRIGALRGRARGNRRLPAARIAAPSAAGISARSKLWPVSPSGSRSGSTKRASGNVEKMNPSRKLLIGSFSTRTGLPVFTVSNRNDRLRRRLLRRSTWEASNHKVPLRRPACSVQMSVSGYASNQRSRRSLRYVTRRCLPSAVPNTVVPDRPQPRMKTGRWMPGRGSRTYASENTRREDRLRDAQVSEALHLRQTLEGRRARVGRLQRVLGRCGGPGRSPAAPPPGSTTGRG